MTESTLSGLVVAVAGAGGPAGQATVRRLAASGATVLATDAHPDRLAEAVSMRRNDTQRRTYRRRVPP